ncbi:ATP-binding protein [Rhodovulum euryhalinum]|nr:ATP-binding protein [Rhodovulum euryhalinum]
MAVDPGEATPLVVEATPLGVRNALAEMRARFAPSSLGPDALGMAETVLAEVLNNIVEHAYKRGGEGPIELRLERAGTRLKADVRDYGEPMPGGVLPGGVLPESDDPDEGPPEGGFGWFLIRALARDLSYVRENGQNRLCFFVPLAEA